ncbi:type IV pilus biogenesis protein PilP [Salmonella enterica]|nr:type IV pilus biogenesis protein PilP [Salmonella enterica]
MKWRGIFMPVRNRAATAAVSATTILVLLALASPGARADTDTGTAGTSPVTVSAEAAPPVPPPGSITLGMLEQIQQKNLLLAAKVQTAQLQRQLAEAGSEASGSAGAIAGTVTPSSSSVPGMPGQQDGRGVSHSQAVARPQVLEISGKGSVLRALLQMPDGSQPEVSAGSRVVIGKSTLTVSRISLSGVTLSDGSELSF